MTPDSPGDLQIHAAAYLRGAQERIVAGLEGLDSSADMLKQAQASGVPANCRARSW